MKRFFKILLVSISIAISIASLYLVAFYFISYRNRINKDIFLSRFDRALELRKNEYRDSSTNIIVELKGANINIVADYRTDTLNFLFSFHRFNNKPFDTLQKVSVKKFFSSYIPDSLVKFSYVDGKYSMFYIETIYSIQLLDSLARKFIQKYFSNEDVEYGKVKFIIFNDYDYENYDEFEVK